MTLKFMSNQSELGRINSKKKADKDTVLFWASKADAIFASCSKNQDAIKKAKDDLRSLSAKLKFHQAEPKEIKSKYPESVQFVVNRDEWVSTNENTDEALDFILGS